MVQATSSDLSSVLHDPNETVLSVLGQGFLGTIIAGGGIGKCILILTDKRLYIKGKSLLGKNWINTDTNILTDKISATSIMTGSNVKAYISCVLGIMLTLMGIINYGGFQLDNVPTYAGVMLLFIGIVGILLGRSRVFQIEYAGGAVGVKATWYPREEMEDFRRAMTSVIDKKINGKR